MDQDLLHEDMNIPDYAAPCGVYCKACESYGNMYWMQVRKSTETQKQIWLEDSHLKI